MGDCRRCPRHQGSSLAGDVRATIYVPAPQLPARRMMFMVRSQRDPMAREQCDAHRSLIGCASAGSRRPVARRFRRQHDRAPTRHFGDGRWVRSCGARPRCVGVYGVMAYSVFQRTRKSACGWPWRDDDFRLRPACRQALRLVAVGSSPGCCCRCAYRVLERLLYQVEPLDPWTFGITAVVLLTVATLASYIPARRSTRIAPVEALRTK